MPTIALFWCPGCQTATLHPPEGEGTHHHALLPEAIGRLVEEDLAAGRTPVFDSVEFWTTRWQVVQVKVDSDVLALSLVSDGGEGLAYELAYCGRAHGKLRVQAPPE